MQVRQLQCCADRGLPAGVSVTLSLPTENRLIPTELRREALALQGSLEFDDAGGEGNFPRRSGPHLSLHISPLSPAAFPRHPRKGSAAPAPRTAPQQPSWFRTDGTRELVLSAPGSMETQQKCCDPACSLLCFNCPLAEMLSAARTGQCPSWSLLFP